MRSWANAVRIGTAVATATSTKLLANPRMNCRRAFDGPGSFIALAVNAVRWESQSPVAPAAISVVAARTSDIPVVANEATSTRPHAASMKTNDCRMHRGQHPRLAPNAPAAFLMSVSMGSTFSLAGQVGSFRIFTRRYPRPRGRMRRGNATRSHIRLCVLKEPKATRLPTLARIIHHRKRDKANTPEQGLGNHPPPSRPHQVGAQPPLARYREVAYSRPKIIRTFGGTHHAEP